MPTRSASRPTRKASKPTRNASSLARPLNPMPPAVRSALRKRGLLRAYRARPAYQQNDYLSWIASAKREDTREKRLSQMLDELERGDRYMNMSWSPRRLATRTS